MTVYTRHRLSASQPNILPVEAFPSIERATRALQLRSTKQKSVAYYADTTFSREERDFPEADTTGFMAVWLRDHQVDGRYAADMPPSEIWHLAPTGRVVRSGWLGALQDQWNADLAELKLPDRLLHQSMTPAQRRAKALAYGQQMPPVTDEFNADFGGIARRMLEDLVPDEEAQDVMLRLLQEFWKLGQK